MSMKAIFGISVSTALGFLLLVFGYFIYDVADNPRAAVGAAALYMAVGVGILVATFLFYRHRTQHVIQVLGAQQVPQLPDTDIELMGKSKRVSPRSDKQ